MLLQLNVSNSNVLETSRECKQNLICQKTIKKTASYKHNIYGRIDSVHNKNENLLKLLSIAPLLERIESQNKNIAVKKDKKANFFNKHKNQVS